MKISKFITDLKLIFLEQEKHCLQHLYIIICLQICIFNNFVILNDIINSLDRHIEFILSYDFKLYYSYSEILQYYECNFTQKLILIKWNYYINWLGKTLILT